MRKISFTASNTLQVIDILRATLCNLSNPNNKDTASDRTPDTIWTDLGSQTVSGVNYNSTTYNLTFKGIKSNNGKFALIWLDNATSGYPPYSNTTKQLYISHLTNANNFVPPLPTVSQTLGRFNYRTFGCLIPNKYSSNTDISSYTNYELIYDGNNFILIHGPNTLNYNISFDSPFYIGRRQRSLIFWQGFTAHDNNDNTYDVGIIMNDLFNQNFPFSVNNVNMQMVLKKVGWTSENDIEYIYNTSETANSAPNRNAIVPGAHKVGILTSLGYSTADTLISTADMYIVGTSIFLGGFSIKLPIENNFLYFNSWAELSEGSIRTVIGKGDYEIHSIYKDTNTYGIKHYIGVRQ